MSEIKGWCPNVYKPMEVEDGLLMRVKPPMGRISKEDAKIIAQISERFGNSKINLTNRANLQIRGLKEETYKDALEFLHQTKLFSYDPDIEARRNIMIAPNWQSGDMNENVYQQLRSALSDFPYVNDKFGYAIDCGEHALLSDTPYDIRIMFTGQHILIEPKGNSLALRTDFESFIENINGLINWFNGKGSHRRMHTAIAEFGLPDMGFEPIHITQAPPIPFGEAHIGIKDGLISAQEMREIADQNKYIQLTPWRSLILS